MTATPVLRSLLAALAGVALAAPPAAVGEVRDPCEHYDALRQPFFGDLHTHTQLSFDAYIFENRNLPDDAHAFAKGEPIGLPPLDPQGQPTRTLTLDRALDFNALTDHSEFLGEISICTADPVPGYTACNVLHTAAPGVAFAFWGQRLVPPPTRFQLCGQSGLACLIEAVSVWDSVQASAEAHYDRSSACTFTTFNAYEWTGGTLDGGVHRNIVFSGDVVPALPLSFFEVQDPAALRESLVSQCATAGPGCDVIAIPHNPNLSAGNMFDPLDGSGQPMTPEAAALRAQLEPLVEIVQHKGESECRFQVGSSDELCSFEKVADGPPGDDAGSSYARNALGIGLQVEADIGVNPFRFGFVGATDNHNGTPGATSETAFVGHVGSVDADPADRLSGDSARFNPGGLTVLWAEENSRDSLFAAMRRRESYATSGTRPIVRLFGGAAYPADLCARSDFVEVGYAGGVPMGGEIRVDAAPSFAVSALMDPGSPGQPGTPLQRIQIVKVSLEDGEVMERVFDVAGSADNGASVDPDTCQTAGSQSASLCAVWTDPSFDPVDPPDLAAWYARVLENPTCRWSTRLCNAQGVDCSQPVPPGFEACCDGSIPQTIQERAYTSPIWYLPEPAGPLALGAGAACAGWLGRRRRERRPEA
jgi:hypothetical protein